MMNSKHHLKWVYIYIAIYVSYIVVFISLFPMLIDMLRREAAFTFSTRKLIICQCISYVASTLFILLFSHLNSTLSKKESIYINLFFIVVCLILFVDRLFHNFSSVIFVCCISGTCLFNLAYSIIKKSNP